MIIANVRRSRRSCRSSLTTIEPSLRRLTRLSPAALLRVAATNTSSRFGSPSARPCRDAGARAAVRRRRARQLQVVLAPSTRSAVPICATRDDARQLVAAPAARGAASGSSTSQRAARQPRAAARCGVPSATMRPRSRIASACSARPRPCSASRRAASCPRSASSNSDSQNSRRDCGSTALVGSSRNSSSGSCSTAPASASRCFWPPRHRAGELLAPVRSSQ